MVFYVSKVTIFQNNFVLLYLLEYILPRVILGKHDIVDPPPCLPSGLHTAV